MKEHKFLLLSAHIFLLSFIFYFVEFFIFNFMFLSGIPVFKQFILFSSIEKYLFFVGIVFVIFDILFVKDNKKVLMETKFREFNIAIGITAYNHGESIRECVRSFLLQPYVKKVIVVDNNSKDNTVSEAIKGGATVVNEPLQGYGSCCIRALKEAMKYGDIVCLVEGDGTYSADDLNKLLMYIENADMVLGTRNTRELNAPDTQMNFFLTWGNLFVAKLLQTRFWSVRLTDLGCTYRLIRKDSLEKIIDKLKITGNHFSCEMIIEALKNNLMVIEIPVTFKKRIGKSEGVGGNIFKAFITGLKMWYLILFR